MFLGALSEFPKHTRGGEDDFPLQQQEMMYPSLASPALGRPHPPPTCLPQQKAL